MGPSAAGHQQRPPLQTLLGDYPTTRALRQGMVASRRLPLVFADVEVPNQAFKRVVRDLEFDVAELALMTFLMARSRDVPLRLLPVVVFSRNPLPHLVYDSGRGQVAPDRLRGWGAPGRGAGEPCRIGVRAYSTTTAVWIRALLADQCGVQLDALEWLTLDDGHVPGVPEPSTVQRAGTGGALLTMLRAGVIEAAIVDRVPAGPPFVPVVPDPEAIYHAWQHRHGARTLNHVIVVRESLAADGEAIRELFALFRQSRERGGATVDCAATPIGLAANRRNLEVAIAVADAQGLLARPLTVDEVVAAVPE